MAMIAEAVLMVQGGSDEGSTITLGGGMLMIGRAPLNDIVLDEPGVSRQHAAIRGDSEGFWLADLGSRNGTYVNGESVGADPRRLRNFDRIELGGPTPPCTGCSWSRSRPWTCQDPKFSSRPGLRFRCLRGPSLSAPLPIHSPPQVERRLPQ